MNNNGFINNFRSSVPNLSAPSTPRLLTQEERSNPTFNSEKGKMPAGYGAQQNVIGAAALSLLTGMLPGGIAASPLIAGIMGIDTKEKDSSPQVADKKLEDNKTKLSDKDKKKIKEFSTKLAKDLKYAAMNTTGIGITSSGDVEDLWIDVEGFIKNLRNARKGKYNRIFKQQPPEMSSTDNWLHIPLKRRTQQNYVSPQTDAQLPQQGSTPFIPKAPDFTYNNYGGK